MDLPMAPLTVPNRIEPCVGVDISPGCLITSEPTDKISHQSVIQLISQLVTQSIGQSAS